MSDTLVHEFDLWWRLQPDGRRTPCDDQDIATLLGLGREAAG